MDPATIVKSSGCKVDCSKAVRLDEATLAGMLADLSPLWRVETVGEITGLTKRFTCKNWQAAIDFINGASSVAEGIGHHPDLSLTKYRDIAVTLVTHSLSPPGLTDLDLVVAKALDAVPIDYSKKFLTENNLSI
jgi:4a-hydroxytetrahydrobiopterin dehydratase